jgi:hypothetical protein
MRLFYLHEQQQTRNQNVLAQLRTQQQLLPSLIPGMAGLALGDPTLSPRHPASMANTPLGANASQQQLFSNSNTGNGSGEVGSAGEVSSGQNVEQPGQKEGESTASAGVEGAVSGGQAEGRAGEADVLAGSGRSSLEKDQGPVVSVMLSQQTRDKGLGLADHFMVCSMLSTWMCKAQAGWLTAVITYLLFACRFCTCLV